MRLTGHKDAAPDCDQEAALAALAELERALWGGDGLDGFPRLHGGTVYHVSRHARPDSFGGARGGAAAGATSPRPTTSQAGALGPHGSYQNIVNQPTILLGSDAWNQWVAERGGRPC